MKTFSVIIILLVSVCLGSYKQPVIVRDKFCESGYFVYLPTDDNGTTWVRIVLNWPMTTPGCDRLYPIAEMHRGIIHPGKWQSPPEASASLGTWSGLTYSGWHIYYNNTAGNYLEWDIPADHNRIHLLSYHVLNSGITSLTLNGQTSGLDITTINHSTGNLIQESVLTTTASGGKLRATVSSNDLLCGIIGIHSFNTNATGNPSTAEAGIAAGHDLVDQCVFYDNTASRLHYETSSGDSSAIWKANTTEFTLKWKEVSQPEHRWTGYGAHYGSTGNADFTPTMDATLFINGVFIGKMYDTAQIPLGKLYSADTITAIVEGYGDYNQNDIQDAEDILNLRITQDFAATGIGITNQVKWSGTWSTQEGPYVPSVNLSDNIIGYVQFPPDQTGIPVGSDFSGKYANSLSVFMGNIDCLISVSSSGPVEQVFEKPLSDKKIYFDINASLLPGAASPAAGDSWAISAHIQFQNQENFSSETSITAWGDNAYGQCYIPFPNIHFAAVAAGQWHSLGLKSSGKIIAWGDNNSGQCNIPDSNDVFTAISTKTDHNLALRRNGSIVAWGNNSSGQCNLPYPNENFLAVAAGLNFSLGLKNDGSIIGWGADTYGQCSNIALPNSGFTKMAAGYYHALGIRSDGSISAWGWNYHGQCATPSPNTDFIAVAAGFRHSLGLKEDGTIVAWGDNQFGQCNIPLPNEDFIAVSARPWGGLALKQNGSLVVWGLGATPLPSPNTNFGIIAAGPSHNLAIIGSCLYTLSGDVNNDCRFDLEDWTIMANNWLMDCQAFPYSPTCVPK